MSTIIDTELDARSLAELQAADSKGYDIWPLYERECESCKDKLPVVAWLVHDPNEPGHTFYRTANLIWSTTGLCGACTWGEAACVDPEEW